MYICSKQSLHRSFVPPRGGGRLSSFTLVEVVIAIGVATFVLISILGMMSYASQMVQQSDKYSRLAIVASQVLAKLGSQEFGTSPYGTWALLEETTYPTPITNFYTYEGLPTNSVNGTNSYFQVIVVDASTGTLSSGGVAFQRVMEPLKVSILWPKPASATVAYANTNIIVTSVLNYNSL